eukprot:TRINITY_DN2881_c0_g1_i1.p1 TRINITY_DN2881_c0_g1~~TRINITY_DN2881_c0_g1_i1.p1  ORF type:complete len:129 (+),score=18.59 TRINITY_DN2881_c0_g1_i1:105-491(+)
MLGHPDRNIVLAGARADALTRAVWTAVLNSINTAHAGLQVLFLAPSHTLSALQRLRSSAQAFCPQQVKVAFLAFGPSIRWTETHAAHIVVGDPVHVSARTGFHNHRTCSPIVKSALRRAAYQPWLSCN